MRETGKRIIDAFTFFNEAEICELRMRVLDRVVDKFVVVEADTTHAGRPKPYNFPALLESRLQVFRDKIVYHPMRLDTAGLDFSRRPADLDTSTAHWKLENAQRNGIDDACRDFAEDDWLVISDVDEIPNPDFLKAIVTHPQLSASLPVALQQYMFCYKLTNLRKEDWRGSVVTTVGRSRSLGAQRHREQRWTMAHVQGAGWHLTYFGNAARIRHKIESFAHQEFNVDGFKSAEHIEQSRRDGRDLFGRAIDVEHVDQSFFPAALVEATADRRDFYW